MLRTILFIGIALIVGSTILGVVLGFAMFALGLAIKVAIVGGIAYLIIRIVSPDTAAMIRSQCQRKSFNRF